MIASGAVKDKMSCSYLNGFMDFYYLVWEHVPEVFRTFQMSNESKAVLNKKCVQIGIYLIKNYETIEVTHVTEIKCVNGFWFIVFLLGILVALRYLHGSLSQKLFRTGKIMDFFTKNDMLNVWRTNFGHEKKDLCRFYGSLKFSKSRWLVTLRVICHLSLNRTLLYFELILLQHTLSDLKISNRSRYLKEMKLYQFGGPLYVPMYKFLVKEFFLYWYGISFIK